MSRSQPVNAGNYLESGGAVRCGGGNGFGGNVASSREGRSSANMDGLLLNLVPGAGAAEGGGGREGKRQLFLIKVYCKRNRLKPFHTFPFALTHLIWGTKSICVQSTSERVEPFLRY